MSDMKGMEGISDDELLTLVNKAIATIAAGGQSYQIGSRHLQRGDLGTLYRMKKEMEERNNETDRGLFGNCSVAVFDGR